MISRRVELVFLYLGGYFVLACYRFFLSGKPGIPTETLVLNCNGNKTYEVELNYDTIYDGESLYYGVIDNGWYIFVFVGNSPSDSALFGISDLNKTGQMFVANI